LSVDPAGQFANAYGYANNPVIMVDPDGNFVFTTFLAAVGIGAAIGAGVSAASYSIGVAASGGDWNFKDFIKKVGIGTLGGAITAGVGSLGTSVATNMVYSTLGNVISYGATNWMTGSEYSAGGLTGAFIGGLAGGLLPGFNGVKGGKFANFAAEVGYGSIRGAAVGGLSGGIGAAISGQNIGKGIGMGAAYGAIGGATGAALKVAAFGTVSQKTMTQLMKEDIAARYTYGTRTGDFKRNDYYGSVNRSGGAFKWLSNRISFLPSGFSFGRNNLNATSGNVMDEIHTHESIHFQQQIKQGVFQFYKQGFYEQYMYNGDPYTDFGTNEWWANFLQ
jgi:hypothetical protein